MLFSGPFQDHFQWGIQNEIQVMSISFTRSGEYHFPVWPPVGNRSSHEPGVVSSNTDARNNCDCHVSDSSHLWTLFACSRKKYTTPLSWKRSQEDDDLRTLTAIIHQKQTDIKQKFHEISCKDGNQYFYLSKVLVVGVSISTIHDAAEMKTYKHVKKIRQ